MLTLRPTVRVFVSLAPADMRRSLDGLAALTREVLQEDPLSGRLFGDAVAPTAAVPAEDDEPDPPPRRRQRHKGRRRLPDSLPREIHELHPPENERTCPACGVPKAIFGQVVTAELEVVPARLR